MPAPIAAGIRPAVFVPRTPSTPGLPAARPVAGPPAAPTPLRVANATGVAPVASSATPRPGLELTLEMPDATTRPLTVELRDVATRWWVPGAVVPDVLQRTGWFPRTFPHTLVPEQLGPTTWRVRLERGWYARLCGAELTSAVGPNVVTVARDSASGPNRANVLLAPARNTATTSASCSLPAGNVGTEHDPLTCTASVAGAPSARATVRLDWPR